MSATANEPRRSIWMNRWLWPWTGPVIAFYVALGLLVVLTTTHMGLSLIEGWPHRSSYETLQNSLNVLRGSVPKGVDPTAWENDVGWTGNLIGNCCQPTQVWNERTGYKTFHDFSEEFARRCATDPDCDTIRWIWDTLPSVSSAGAEYQYWRSRFQVCQPDNE